MNSSESLKKVNLDYLKYLHKADNPPGLLKKQIESMNKHLEERRALARGKVLPTFVRPIFLTLQQMKRFKEVVEIMLGVQEKVIRLYFESPEHSDLFQLKDKESALVKIPSRLERFIYFSRMDTIFTENSFKFLEFNCDSPGGAYYSDIQTELLLDLPFMKELSLKWKFKEETYRPKVLKALLSAWKSAGRTEKPRIAVMGNPDVANVEEFKLFAEYFVQLGYEAFFSDPWHADYNGKTLSVDGNPVDLIYRRGVLKDYSQRWEEVKPIIQAYKDGNVLFANPLNAKLGDNKNLLGLMTSERFTHLFTKQELSVIQEHIPWTRPLKDTKTEYQGSTIDLIEFVRIRRKNMVIKPNAEYGGRGVLIGHETSQSIWDDALERSFKENLVVQEYVPIPIMEFPVFSPNLTMVPKKTNMNFFTFAGNFGGGFARTSDSSVINISKGGALVAFVTVEGLR